MNRFVRAAYKCVGSGTAWVPAVVCGMGVRTQRDNKSCGPASLRYCFMKWEHDVSQERLYKLTKADNSGTSEHNLHLACRALGYSWRNCMQVTKRSAKETIINELSKGSALVICVDDWKHWVSVLHHSKRGFLVFDPGEPGPVIQLVGWKRLAERLYYVPRVVGLPVYGIFTVKKLPVQRKR